jgi:hypothetical protein
MARKYVHAAGVDLGETPPPGRNRVGDTYQCEWLSGQYIESLQNLEQDQDNWESKWHSSEVEGCESTHSLHLSQQRDKISTKDTRLSQGRPQLGN